ncbi:DUF4270 domain-containing protein [Flavobacterium luteum]|uniref:DUF4270 domain-containing protein n=1 Tax=Flavobacterium luteum TaxID=2026654 RepID=A0A7J5AH03_9FLAO|nr:DUF4270 domain-containing protein [Flavobacterium luteum]KAB1156902.1 DUF4270 domain-containing protein [Flavobacterium luteum]
MNNNSFKSYILFALTTIFFASCDKDFNGIGTDIIGDDNFEIKQFEKSVVAFNQNLGPVQSNNLPINALGIYNNPAFGETTANFATQVVLQTVNPTIDVALKPEIESVVLYIPYFSIKTKLKEDGVGGIYELDSIYGPAASKIKLGIYESGYYMRDFDPATQDSQVYNTNQNSLFDNVKGQLLYTNEEFVFSDAELTEINSETKEVTARKSPGIELTLNKDFFTEKIINASPGKLTTNDVFKNYFRGLYFKVEKSGTSSQLALIDFRKGTITVKYKENKSLTETDEKDRVSKSIVLNLTGNSVNLFQNNYSQSYIDGITSPNTTDGDEKLYLKGGEGSMGVINIFKDNELDLLRTNKWLINDAILTFTIDATTMANASEPNRIYLYDLNNKKQLLDYTFDSSLGSSSKFNKNTHGGIIEKETVSKRGIRYKIRLTNHIRNLISNDTVTNVKLGLVVTENIADVSNKKLATPVFAGNIKQIPTSSVINPLGTVLFGTNPKSEDQDKRLKFEIYYTKPN